MPMASMILPPAVSGAALGAQRPRILHVPDFESSTGAEAVELAAMAGLELDPWQQFVLEHSLGERADGRWAAFEVGVEVPRQNGKGALLEARELAGLFLLGESLIIHSAHEFATAEEALERMAALLEGCPPLWRRVKTVKRSHGQEGIYLKNGQRLRYRTRTKGGGRGFSADCVILDEAMEIPEAMHGALMPTLSARPNPQLWYTGSAVDQERMDNGIVFARVRERAVEGEDPALAYFGWSPPFDLKPSEVPAPLLASRTTWAQANPALGIRITAEHIAKEHRSMDPRTFAVERLGVGDWPRVSGADGAVISVKSWLSLVDQDSKPVDPICFVYDVSPDRSSAAVAVAGKRDDGLLHVEILEHKRGTGWLLDWLPERVERHDPFAVLYAKSSPAAALASSLENAGVTLEAVSNSDYGNAYGVFFDLVDQRLLRHLGTGELVNALRGAARRPLGEAWAWSRKTSSVDITPLVAVTIGAWAVEANAGEDSGAVMAFTDDELASALD
jgi:hypothetical protein